MRRSVSYTPKVSTYRPVTYLVHSERAGAIMHAYRPPRSSFRPGCLKKAAGKKGQHPAGFTYLEDTLWQAGHGGTCGASASVICCLPLVVAAAWNT